MASELNRRRLQDARDLIRTGRAGKALEIAEGVLLEEPNDAEATLVFGVSLSEVGRAEEATQALRKAVELDPENAVPHLNLAAHLDRAGDRTGALASAKEAVRLNPDHIQAKGMVASLSGEAPLPVGGSKVAKPKEPADAETGAERAGYPERLHILPWMYGQETRWEWIGRTFLVMAIGLALLMIFNYPAGQTGVAVPKGELPDVQLRTDTLSIFTVFLYIVSSICTFMWMLIDIVDKRMRFTWLVPVFVCGTVGMNVLPLALYMFIGRKLGNNAR